MRIDVVTVFPDLVFPHLEVGLLGKAVREGTIQIKVHDLREHGLGKHRSVDDEPYGGGPGMVMRPEPFFEAVEQIDGTEPHRILLAARGRRLVHEKVIELSKRKHLILLCGRYEGVDERVAEHLCDEELSIGDFVLHGGEVAALTVIEAVSRHIPGVLGNPDSLSQESHSDGKLEYPQYTRPVEYRGHRVPDILLSGNHSEIEKWRSDRAAATTMERRLS
jgi:tRNA (guanine37-N1)-methyltransferase